MKKNILVFIIFVLLIIIMTFPLVFKINSHIPGFFSTDEPYLSLWGSWRIKYCWENNLSLMRTDLIAYPFGVSFCAVGYLSYLWIVLFHTLSILTTPVLNYNIQVLSNFFLSALFTYLLVFYLTKNRLGAFLSSIIFAFCPYQFARTWQHLALTYNQWIPMCLLASICLREKKSKKTAALFLLSLLLLFSFDYFLMYITTFVIICFIIYIAYYHLIIKLFKQKKLFLEELKYFRKVIFLVAIVFIILLPQFLPVIKNMVKFSSITSASAFNPYRRPFEDLFTQSARPLSYFIPASSHPIFGKFTERFIGSFLYGDSFTEHTLYLGWIPLLLAFFAFRKWRKKRKQISDIDYRTLTERDDFYIGFFLFLAFVAWIFSQPPWWKFGPIKIYMPSFLMYKILPMFRAYCRFGIVVMLAVAVLSGFGLNFILGRFKSGKAKITISCLFLCLVIFEFWNYPPFKVIDVSKVPAVYYWLKEQPGDIVIAEYPLDADSPSTMYKFYQTKHKKRIINGTVPTTHANKLAKTITRLSEQDTANVLKSLGVKFILVHRDDYLSTGLIRDREELDAIPQNTDLKFIRSFMPQKCPTKNIMCSQKTGQIDVYEIVAKTNNN